MHSLSPLFGIRPWTDFATAMQFYRHYCHHGDVLGIGIVLGDGLVGVDPDNCLAPDGTLKDWARPIVDGLDSYFEVSPSGTGLKGFAFGSLDAVRRRPEYARRKNKKGEVAIPTRNSAGDGEVELYDHGRFFCITGHRFGAVGTVNDRTEQLIGLFDRFIAKEPGRASSGPARDEPDWLAQMRAEERAGLEATAWTRRFRGDLTTLDVEGLWRAAGLRIEPDGHERFRLQCPNRMAHSDPDDLAGTVCFKREGEYPRFVCKRTACREAGYGIRDALLALGPDLVDSFCAEAYGGRDDDRGDHEPKREKSPGGRLVTMALSSCELVRADDGTAYARVAIDGHRETMALEGPAFKSWLCGMYFDETGRTARSEAVREALQVLIHKAARMPKRPVHLRIAHTGDTIYWDLGDDSWRAVEVTRDGWRIVDDPPVVFRRTPNTAALPEPERGGSLDDMRPFVNLTEADWVLYKGAILVAAHGAGPFFIVTVHGEQGSAKTWACRLPKRLLDPVGAAELRTGLPGDDKAWIARLQGHYILGFDNVSRITPDQSDFLCTLATGGGQEIRKLYTDSEQVVHDYKRPVYINGIPDFTEKGDLLNRTIMIEAPILSEKVSEKLLVGRWQRALPGIMGGLLDLLAAGLRRWEATPEPGAYRMADAVRWATACLGDDSFRAAYDENQHQAARHGLSCSPLAPVLLRLLEGGGPPPLGTGTRGRFRGTSEQLRKAVVEFASAAGIALPRSFPELSHIFSRQLRRDAALLRGRGIDVRFLRVKGDRLIDIRPVDPVDDAESTDDPYETAESPAPSRPVTEPDECRATGDGPFENQAAGIYPIDGQPRSPVRDCDDWGLAG